MSINFWGCDKIDNPIPDDLGTVIPGGNVEFIVDPSLDISDSAELVKFIDSLNWVEVESPDNSAERFIIIEEFTGHTCINCVPGTEEIVRLDGIYGAQLIPIGVHAGTFAIPHIGQAKYFVDFRPPSDNAEEIFNIFNPEAANPRGVVNRLTNSSGNAKSLFEWEKDIKSFENDAPSVSLLINNFFDSTANIIRSRLTIEWLVGRTETFNIQLLVLEDHIIAYQKDQQDPRIDIPDYDHRHVLRKFVNGTFGKELDSTNVGNTNIIEYIYPFNESLQPNNNKNIEVVAFIYFVEQEKYEIIQANAVKIVNK